MTSHLLDDDRQGYHDGTSLVISISALLASTTYAANITVVELISENASNLRTLIFGEFPNIAVVELISENAPNLRTLIFGEFPNLHCENAPC
jgi:hypothetical protein